MPYCCVMKCSNSWKTGHSMHRLPRNIERKQHWLVNIERNNMDVTKDWFVCEVHFSPEIWEKPRIDGKKKLKYNAIPTIFPQKNKNQIVTALSRVHDNEIIFNSSNDEVHITTLSPVPDNEMISHSFDAKEEVERIKIRAKQTEIKLKKANAIIFKLDKSKTLLKRNARKLMDENKKLVQKIRILETSKNIDIRKILNDDQVVALDEQNPRSGSLKWSNNTIIKALRLKMFCGSTSYTELLNQNISLSSERTLRRKLENIKFETGVCNDIFDIYYNNKFCNLLTTMKKIAY
ncbi:THAP domain-containing protein 2 isoform X2 [Mycetomoellerius zeteki]|uniref:THAP domain-containing protein 2 isoform X2 n=1 Tax=Mycetomoellerius zeteki TaxID=64791 RepID=UPI00084E958B|nr:PREDICTED: THAP domain-containing protein 2-like isoform X2 [Trachymyrmex zeteki]